MTRVLAIANPKGGVGKTTTAINLAACLVERKRTVLAIDFDPQASLTRCLGHSSNEPSPSFYDTLASTGVPVVALVKPTAEGFDLLPAHESLNQAIDLLEGSSPQLLGLRSAIEPLRARYDYILIDTPANAGVLTGSALAAADEVLIPLTADYLALQSLDWFLSIVRQVTDLANPTLRVTGVFFNLLDPRARHARAVMVEARARHGTTIPFLATSIPFRASLRDAALAGQSILRHDARSRAVEGYRALAIEIDEGLRVTPKNEIYFVMAQAQQALLAGSHESAYAFYCRATELNPQLATAWSGRAASAAAWDEKIRGYGRALRLEPDKPERRAELEQCVRGGVANSSGIPALMTSAQFLESIGENPSARRLYQRIVELDPRQEEAWMGQARTAADLREELLSLQRCLEINPTSELARQAVRETQERARQEAGRLIEQGMSESRLGNPKAARLLLTRACELNPRSDRAALELARVAEDLPTAYQCARKALELNPRNPEARELCIFLRDSDASLTVPAPPRPGWVVPAIAIALLAVAILAFSRLPVSSLMAVVLPSSPVQATPTRIVSMAVAVVNTTLPTTPPTAPPTGTATATETTTPTVTHSPFATATRVLASATGMRVPPSPTRVPRTATLPTATRTPFLVPTDTPTSTPTRLPTGISVATATRAVVLRYPSVILREPHDDQKIQQETVTFEWTPIALTQPGDHYELQLTNLGNPDWVKRYRVAGGKFVLGLEPDVRYGYYAWGISILDAQGQVVSPVSETRRLPWEPRSSSGSSGGEGTPVFVKPPIFVK